MGVGIEEGVRERGRRKQEKGEGVEKKIEGWGEDRRERRGGERRKELKKRERLLRTIEQNHGWNGPKVHCRKIRRCMYLE